MEVDRRVDPKELSSGEFGDTTSTMASNTSRGLSLYEERRQQCIAAGYTEDQIRAELEAMVRVLGD